MRPRSRGSPSRNKSHTKSILPGLDHQDRERDSHSHSRSRSRSPDESERKRHHRHHYHRHHPHHSRRHERGDSAADTATPVPLPFGVRQLTKQDLPFFKPMLAMYLDIHKELVLETLCEAEIKGRWKSFVGRWNRGELAEGWYDPNTLEKARRNAEEYQHPESRIRASPDYGLRRNNKQSEASAQTHMEEDFDQEERGEEDEDLYGPQVLPSDTRIGRLAHKSGPTIPNMQDLELRREAALAEEKSTQDDERKQRRADILAHKSQTRIIEDEVASRAEPGTHERRLEKRKEAAAANREFARTTRGGSPTDAAPDAELMGEGDDLETLRKAREREQRKKNERETRREEILRARAAEREERIQKYRRKEEETIGWLKALAKQKYG